MKNIFCFFFCFGFIIAVQAQYGEIKGKITDQATAFSVAKAIVSVTDSSGDKIGKEVKTDVYGYFTVTSLSPGKYNLHFSSPAYISQSVEGIIVLAEKTTFINISFAPAPKKKKSK